MIDDFDFDPASGRIALLCRSVTGERWLEIRSSAGEELRRIPPDYLPFHPRWSPDGKKLTFSGNDGRIAIHDISRDETTIVYDDNVLKAGFSRWSPDGSYLAFTAYGRSITERGFSRPPDLFRHDIETGITERLTESNNFVDRFPAWSPSGRQIAFHRYDLDEVEKPQEACIYDRTRNSVRSILDGSASQHFGCFPGPATSGGSHSVNVPNRDTAPALSISTGRRLIAWSFRGGRAFSRPSRVRPICSASTRPR